MQSVLIAGCGFLGEAAAGFFVEQGARVVALTASPESATRLADRPFEITCADLSREAEIESLRARYGPFDAVVHCASSGRGGAEAYRAVYVNGCRHLAAAFPEARLLFTSSTSVYGQADGSVVSEISPAAPDRETGRLLLEAEGVTLAARGLVLRLAGIYGPNRSVLLRKFRDGTARLEAGGTRWINQIHRDDAARAILTALEHGSPGTIYNVVDDAPSTQLAVYTWIAAALKAPLPPSGPADPLRKRGLTSKRVSNARLRSLGWSPAFPTYAEALPHLLAADPD